MKKMLYCLCLPLLGLLSDTAAAMGLTVPDYDASYSFLTSMFGYIPGVLTKYAETADPVLKGPLIELNYAVMILGGVFILYALVVSTIKTAHEGEMLGKQWNSVWIPIRSALGVALLLPAGTTQTATGTYAGYSIAQAIVMWIVIQGISIADTVWANVACALYLGEAVTVGSPAAMPADDMNAAMGQLFTNLVCSAGLASVEGLGTHVTQWKSKKHWNFTDPANGGYFGTKDDQYPCGRIAFPGDPSNNEEAATVTAVNDAVGSLGTSASVLVNDMNAQGYILTDPQTMGFQSDITDQASNYISTVSNGIKADGNEKKPDAPSGNDASSNQLASACTANGQPNDPTVAFGGGWIMAGAYYLSMVKEAQATAKSQDDHNDPNPQNVSPPSVTSYSTSKINQVLMDDQFTQWQLYTNTAAALANNASVSGLSDTLGDALSYTPPTFGGNIPPLRIINSLNHIVDGISKALSNFILSWSTLLTGSHCGTSGIINGTLGQCNPIATIQAFGNATLDVIELLYVVMITGWIALGIVAFILPCCNPFSISIPWIISIVSPIAFALIGTLISSGMVMAYYVPMIPFIVFTFSGIGWLISVVEAMVAAPIVALGILHPEGHEVYGKAEPAVMLLISTFLKPVLLIVGFIASTELVVIAVALVNTAFAIMTPQMLSGYLVGILTVIAVIALYTLLIWMAVQKSFTLIHVIPDRALRWIGHYDQFGIGPSEQELQMSKRSMDEAGGQAGGAAKSTSDGQMKAADMKKARDAERAEKAAKASSIVLGGI